MKFAVIMYGPRMFVFLLLSCISNQSPSCLIPRRWCHLLFHSICSQSLFFSWLGSSYFIITALRISNYIFSRFFFFFFCRKLDSFFRSANNPLLTFNTYLTMDAHNYSVLLKHTHVPVGLILPPRLSGCKNKNKSLHTFPALLNCVTVMFVSRCLLLLVSCFFFFFSPNLQLII